MTRNPTQFRAPTYNGIPIIELGDEAEQVITLGHVDKTEFAKAYDAYLEEMCGDDRFWSQRFTTEEFAAEAWYGKARIRYPEEFPNGEFEVIFDNSGDLDVTVRDNL